MSAALTIIVSMLFVFRSFNLTKAYFLFVFLIPFLPSYIGIGAGSGGFSLSLIRIMLAILFAFMIIFFIQRQKFLYENISLAYLSNKNLINVLALFFVLKVFSLLINSTEMSLYIKLFNDFLFSIFIFSLTVLFIDSNKSIQHLMKTIFYSYSIVLAFILVESILKHPPLSMFISETIEIVRDRSEGYSRNNAYRYSGSFLSPILLGEFLVVMIPLVIAYLNTVKYSLILKSVYLIFFLFAIYSTNSRSAILLTLVAVYLYVLFISLKGNNFTRVIATFFNLILIGTILYFIISYIIDLNSNFTGRFDYITDAEQRSSTSRALQFSTVFQRMEDNAWFGLGKKRNFVNELDGAIDNYYLWTYMEVGIIGLSCYFLFIFLLLKEAFNQYKSPQINYYLIPLIISILVSITYQFLTSNPTNHIYLYIFSGLICTMRVLQNKSQYDGDQLKKTKNKPNM